MSELTQKLHSALGGWGAVKDLIAHIECGAMSWNGSSVSTVRGVCKGIHNPYLGSAVDVEIEISPHDKCGKITVIDPSLLKSRVSVDITNSSTCYKHVLEEYHNWAKAEEISAEAFFN